MLDAFYFLDPRVSLVPIEHLGPDGIDAEFAERLAARPGWSAARVALLDDGFALYWERQTSLARRTGDLLPPRLRNVAVVHAADAVRPYASLLNTSTWTLYACDLDPERSDPELVAYLLAHGERMTETGEVTLAAVHLAAWWFERSEDERQAFRDAAHASTRPDAAAFRAIADALPWLRELRHVRLRPPRQGAHRPIAGTGLLVPRAREALPDRLVAQCRDAATSALTAFHTRWRGADAAAADELCAWLERDRPPLLITGTRGAILWDPDAARQTDVVRERLRSAATEVLHEIRADLAVVARHTRRFLAALADPSALPPTDPTTAQSGYSYLHVERRMIAYNLDEPGIERLAGPSLPYARAMLGARTVHEWAHLAVDGGLVPRTVDEPTWQRLLADLAARLDDTIAHAPRAIRERCASDLRALARDGSAGGALAAIFASRIPDYRSNLLGFPFLDLAEREAYVRQNVRPLAAEYPPAQLWRQVVRTLYELQYLGFSQVPDPRRYFFGTTRLEHDFIACGALDVERFDMLAAAARALCTAHAVDGSRITLPSSDG
jgi:hypothetical protein